MKKGFTLIELLLTVGILGILSAVTLSVINGATLQKRARDSQRVGDLKRIQTALELYYADFRNYPVAASWAAVSASSPSGLSSYIQNMPDDPTVGKDYWYYRSAIDKYSLCANLEDSRAQAQCDATSGCSASCGAAPGFCCVLNNP